MPIDYLRDGMPPAVWRRFVRDTSKKQIAGKHLFELCRPGNEYGVNDAFIEPLREPERTQCIRVHAGLFPFTRGMVEAMPEGVRAMVKVCYDHWKEMRKPERKPHLGQMVATAMFDDDKAV
jgi:hypothetical protein